MDPPFVSLEELKSGQTCGIDMPEKDGPWTYCINTTTTPPKHYCCSGLVIDLLLRLAQNASFTFDLHLSKDGYYGGKNSTTGVWKGVVGELGRNEADMAVAALTINQERDAYIDFSKPWLYHGITILEKKVCRIEENFNFKFKYTCC